MFDAATVAPPLSVAVAADGGSFHAQGDLVVAVGTTPLARLFDDPFPQFRVSRRTRSVTIAALAVDGVEPGIPRAALQRVADLVSSR